MRKYLWERDFTEVETPMLQTLAVEPLRALSSRANALDCQFYMRIALSSTSSACSLLAKIVFEIDRVFRNESFSRRHKPNSPCSNSIKPTTFAA